MLSLLLVHLFKLHLFLKLKFWLVRQAKTFESLTNLNSKGNANDTRVSSYITYLLTDTCDLTERILYS